MEFADQIKEMQKCHRSFNYFCENYVVGPPLWAGETLAHLTMYPFLKRLIQTYKSSKYVAVKKFRRGGFTTTTLAWFLWKALFLKKSSFLVVSCRLSESMALSRMMDLIISHLPIWMQPQLTNTEGEKVFENGTVMSFGTMGLMVDKSRADVTVDDILIDEAAFITNMNSMWLNVLPLVDKSKKLIVVSTPGLTIESLPDRQPNWFYTVVSNALSGRNVFELFSPHYTDHPAFQNEAAMNDMRLGMTPVIWRKEFLAEFTEA